MIQQKFGANMLKQVVLSVRNELVHKRNEKKTTQKIGNKKFLTK